MSAVTDALAARQPPQAEHWWSPIVEALTGGPSWSDQASQLRVMQQQHAPLEQRMALASGLLGGFGGSIKAYHGSPHMFPPEPGYPMGRFKDSAIGTGEGAQAYAYGHYFAENPAVSEGYRNSTGALPTTAGGQPFDLKNPEHVAAAAHGLSGSRAEAIATMDEGLQDIAAGRDPGIDEKTIRAARELLQSDRQLPSVDQGHLYEVNLAPDPEDLLHWDKPLSEQSDKVKEALGRVKWASSDIHPTLGRKIGDLANRSDITGADFYEGFGKLSGHHASAALRDAGIPGIRYLDGGSRSAGEGSHNVVLFDPSQAQIVSRNGQPVTDALMAR